MLTIKAHAKINWTLDILGTREDGYHLMDMLMQAVELHDLLWMEEADTLILENAADEPGAPVKAAQSDALGSEAVTYGEKNLVYRAAKLLRDTYGVEKGARMRLLKRIPSGAGMGGGSADAAAALRGLNELWQLHIPEDTLLALGLKLGADVPFMLSPAPEVWLVMLQPCGGLSTREVFGAFDALDPASLDRPDTKKAQEALLACDLPALGKAMNNVLEGVSVKARPALAQSAKLLEELGAVRGMMTGSGSVVYGVFESREKAETASEKLKPIALANGWGDVWVTHTVK